jgi:hypothetical protein
MRAPHWQIDTIEKVSRKNKAVLGDQSRLRITWQHPEHGKTTLEYRIHSAAPIPGYRTSSSHKLRQERYSRIGQEHRVGSSGIVKDLDPIEPRKVEALGLPPLVYKSLHVDGNDAKVFEAVRSRATDDFQHFAEATRNMLKHSTTYYRAAGLAALSGLRRRRSTSIELPFLVMEKLPEGCDLSESATRRGRRAAINASRDLMTLFVKQLAHIEYLYELNNGLGILDIKPENMAGHFDSKGRLIAIQLLDVDNAFSKHAVASAATLNAHFHKRIARHMRKNTKPAGDEAREFDRHILANTAMEILLDFGRADETACIKQDFFEPAGTCRYQFDKRLDRTGIADFYRQLQTGEILEQPAFADIYRRELERLRKHHLALAPLDLSHEAKPISATATITGASSLSPISRRSSFDRLSIETPTTQTSFTTFLAQGRRPKTPEKDSSWTSVDLGEPLLLRKPSLFSDPRSATPAAETESKATPGCLDKLRRCFRRS